MKDPRREHRAAFSVCMLLSLAIVAGCGDDDDPVVPDPPVPQEFTEEVAVSQVLPAVGMITAMLDEIPGYADGVGAKIGDEAFTYDEADDRWEAATTFEHLGFAWDLDVHLQYLNDDNLPEQDVEDAVRMSYGYTGTAHYAAGGVTIDQTHEALMSIVNLVGSPEDPQTVLGGGEFSMTQTVTDDEETTTTLYEATWDIDDDGIEIPDLDCPIGVVRFDFAPYELRLTLDGTSTLAYVLAEGNNPVGEGGTTTLSCGP